MSIEIFGSKLIVSRTPEWSEKPLTLKKASKLARMGLSGATDDQKAVIGALIVAAKTTEGRKVDKKLVQYTTSAGVSKSVNVLGAYIGCVDSAAFYNTVAGGKKDAMAAMALEKAKLLGEKFDKKIEKADITKAVAQAQSFYEKIKEPSAAKKAKIRKDRAIESAKLLKTLGDQLGVTVAALGRTAASTDSYDFGDFF